MQFNIVSPRLKYLLIMKLLIFFTLVFTLQVSAKSFGQKVTLSANNSPLEKLFKEVKKQTGYTFVYTREQLKNSLPVTIQVTNTPLKDFLSICFKNQPLSFIIEDNYVVVQSKTATEKLIVTADSLIDIKGKVVNENGEPLDAVTILSKKTNKVSISNKQGEFFLNNIPNNDVFIISSVGYKNIEFSINNKSDLFVKLDFAVGVLDETIVMGYGKTSRRLNTGNIGKVGSDEILRQPVSNPLAALEGRIPGVLVTQSSGVPGAAFSIEIRGRSTLDLSLSRNDPLIVIDGVPFESGNLATNQIKSAANRTLSTESGGLSPLNTINPSSIESIEVLKDADATSIYGSRGANGVILITTKTAKSGVSSISASVASGISKVTRTMDMLNTQQYIAMRREAFYNDNKTITTSAAPDLLLWDTTRYTDFKKLLIGNNAEFTDAQLSLSGGTAYTKFLIGAGYHFETNVFSPDLSDRRTSFNASLNHKTANDKFILNFTSYYANDKNKLIQSDLTQYINIPPNFLWKDSLGKPNWSERGYSISTFPFSIGKTPLAELEKKYNSLNENLSANILMNYKITKSITLRTNLGYNIFTTEENSETPKSSLDPASRQLASAKFSNAISRNWVVEPQIEFNQNTRYGKINILAGTTLQERILKSNFINASNYTNDLLLSSLNAAGSISATDNFIQYRYTAFFGRVNYNFNDKYILNISARRDGSSRFGPGKQFANFSAVGAAWIISNESFFKNRLKAISFAKIRISHGLTGNDQIGDYKYLNLWSSTAVQYQGISALEPVSLFNPNFEWEKNKKLEVAIDLGFFKDRLLLAAALYRNRSSNQLVNYLLPDQTGFTSITKNLPALVQNSGLELSLSTINFKRKNLIWATQFTLTIPRNKLISFPGLAASSYNYIYKEGQSLSTPFLLKYIGVNKESGLYQFEDRDNDGQITFPNDYSFGESTDPKFYGGLQNSIQIKNFEFSFFLDFRNQVGKNYLGIIGGKHPGVPINQPLIVLGRWIQNGNTTEIQRFTSQSGGTAGLAAYNLSRSDGIFSDASFIRVKNISLNYFLNEKLIKKFGIKKFCIYSQLQNVGIFTKYKGSDPETQNFYVLPPLKTIVAGIKLNF